MNYIYKIQCKVNNKIYIGSTRNKKGRFSRHKSGLSKNKHGNIKMQNDYNKYGRKNFSFMVVYKTEEQISRTELLKLEDKFIKKYDSINNGYNRRFNYTYMNKTFNDDVTKLLDKENRELVRQLTNEGTSFRAVARHFNVSVYKLTKILSTDN